MGWMPLAFFSFSLLGFCLSLGYALFSRIRRSALSPVFPIVVLAMGLALSAGLILLILLGRMSNVLFPAISAAGILILVFYPLLYWAATSLDGKFPFSWKEGIVLVLIPIAWFLGGTYIFKIGGGRMGDVEKGLGLAFLIASFFLFGFLAARAGFTAALKLKRTKIGFFVVRVIFCLALPLGALSLNFAFIREWGRYMPILGGFGSPLCFALAGLSGLLLCLPESPRPGLRLALFFLRLALFPYSLYFFIIFLPFTILVPFTIFFFGLGLLLLLPLCNFLLHLYCLAQDWKAVNEAFIWKRILPALILSLCLLPAGLYAHALLAAVNLKSAIAWIDADDPHMKKARIDIGLLERSLALSEKNAYLPLLSECSQSIVFGGRILNDRSLARLENAFLPKRSGLERLRYYESSVNFSGSEAGEFSLKAELEESVFDYSLGLQRSRIGLRLQYKGNQALGEYRLGFQLPRAAWLKDYYLYVGEDKRPGRIFSRGAAVSIYQSIVRTRRDPGLLSVSPDNRVELRVFPFSPGEIRRTGFDIYHAAGKDLALGDTIIRLPSPQKEQLGLVPDWILGSERSLTLPELGRKPYLHIIADASASSLENRNRVGELIALGLRLDLPAGAFQAPAARVSWVDYEERLRCDPSNYQSEGLGLKARGGFLPMRAIQSISLEAAKNDDNSYPIFIIASTQENALEGWARAEEYPDAVQAFFPETAGIYLLYSDDDVPSGLWELGKDSGASAVSRPRIYPVIKLPGQALLRRGSEAFVFSQEPVTSFGRIAFENARPSFSAHEKKEKEGILYSLAKDSGFLNPAVSAIVLEEDSQYRRVEDEEKRLKAEESGEGFQEMGLPWPVLALVLSLAALFFHRFRRVRFS